MTAKELALLVLDDGSCGALPSSTLAVLYREADTALRACAEAPAPKKCVIGEYCHKHGWIHGTEAEQLREGVEKILDEVDHEVDVADASNELDRRLRVLLDDTDARDSAAFASARAVNIEGSDGGPLPTRAEAPATDTGETMEQQMGEMHWNDGWMFKRVENGDVRIRKQVSDPDSGEPLEVTAIIPAAEWVSLIHHLGRQQTAESFQVARELHGDF